MICSMDTWKTTLKLTSVPINLSVEPLLYICCTIARYSHVTEVKMFLKSYEQCIFSIYTLLFLQNVCHRFGITEKKWIGETFSWHDCEKQKSSSAEWHRSAYAYNDVL